MVNEHHICYKQWTQAMVEEKRTFGKGSYTEVLWDVPGGRSPFPSTFLKVPSNHHSQELTAWSAMLRPFLVLFWCPLRGIHDVSVPQATLAAALGDSCWISLVFSRSHPNIFQVVQSLWGRRHKGRHQHMQHRGSKCFFKACKFILRGSSVKSLMFYHHKSVCNPFQSG